MLWVLMTQRIALLQAQGVISRPPPGPSQVASTSAKRIHKTSSASLEHASEGPSKRARLGGAEVDEIKPKVNDEDEDEDEDDLNVLKVREELLKFVLLLNTVVLIF